VKEPKEGTIHFTYKRSNSYSSHFNPRRTSEKRVVVFFLLLYIRNDCYHTKEMAAHPKRFIIKLANMVTRAAGLLPLSKICIGFLYLGEASSDIARQFFASLL